MFFLLQEFFSKKNSKIMRLPEIIRNLSMSDKSTFMDFYGKIKYQQIFNALQFTNSPTFISVFHTLPFIYKCSSTSIA